MVDVLHTCDQGITSHIIGNIFADCIIRDVFGGGSRDRNAALLHSRVDAWSKEVKVDSRVQGAITWERIRTTNGFPKFKAKAAATRHLMPFALRLAQEFCEKRVVALAQLMVEFYQILERDDPLILSELSIRRLPTIGRQVCAIYGHLSREHYEQQQRAYKLVPKFHLFLHLCEWQIPETKLNPRSYWTYADEDVVGQLVEVAEHCHVRTLPSTALAKWILLALD